DIAGSTRFNRVNRLDRAIAASDEDEIARCKRCWCCDFRIRRQTPEFFSRQWIVSADRPRTICNDLCSALSLIDRRSSPRRDLFARRFPYKLPILNVIGSDEGIFLNVSLDYYEILIDDWRAAMLPLIIGVEEPAGIEHPNILLPQQLAVQVVGIKTV